MHLNHFSEYHPNGFEIICLKLELLHSHVKLSKKVKPYYEYTYAFYLKNASTQLFLNHLNDPLYSRLF